MHINVIHLEIHGIDSHGHRNIIEQIPPVLLFSATPYINRKKKNKKREE